ncbi:MAG: dTMP kinase [Chloroflexi bacterium]|nr:dTMP kinase [Actinomycetota bacterium]MCL5959085.1 dTMP kinase [Chloroflexota bacterium]
MFITFEGPEGAGKTTQARLLLQSLEQQRAKAILLREPGGTPLGDRLRDIVKHARDLTLSPRTEVLLFAASRAQLVDEVIRPRLDQGYVVICDRYADSTLAYQGYGRGLPLDNVGAVVELASDGVSPDLTFLLDLPPDLGLARNKQESAQSWDRFEEEEIEFHHRVREGYLQLAKQDPGRWVVLDATRPLEDLHAEIRRVVTERLKRALGQPS